MKTIYINFNVCQRRANWHGMTHKKVKKTNLAKTVDLAKKRWKGSKGRNGEKCGVGGEQLKIP